MMALDYNHDLKAAEKNIAASVEIEKSAKADLKPKLSGAANFQYTGNPLELTLDAPSIGLSKTVEGKQLNYGGSLSFATDLYGRTCIGVYPYGETSTIIGKQSGGGTE